MIEARVVDDLGALERLVPEWDAMAVAAARPYCAPDWLLAWWRHAAPAGARLRVAVALEDDRLIGLAPFYARPARGRAERLALLGAGASNRVQPLAAPGRSGPVAAQLAAALSGLAPSPSLVTLAGVAASTGWPELLSRHWVGRGPATLRVVGGMPAPTVDLRGASYEQWLAGKSRNFRQQMRRAARRLEASGACFRRIDARQEVVAALPDLMNLHRQRMRAKREHSALQAPVDRMLAGAAASLAPRGRMWLWTIEAEDGRAISSHLFVAAGGEVAYWLGGFDDGWADAKPGLAALLRAVEDGFALGADRLDLGAGGQHYKGRLADGRDELIEAVIVPRTARYPLTRAQVSAQQLGRRVAVHLSDDQRRGLRRLLRRST